MKDAEVDVDKLTEHFRREHADEIRQDARGFKKRIVRRLQRGLPPKTGTPQQSPIR